MSGREAGLWKWLRIRVSDLGHFSRVESETSAGIPDVHFQVGTFDSVWDPLKPAQGWIELKADRTQKEKYPFKATDKGLRDTQIRWMTEYLENGGQNLLICYALDNRVCISVLNQETLRKFNLYSREQLIQIADLVFPRTSSESVRAQAYQIRKLFK